jgi:hypothetical protein
MDGVEAMRFLIGSLGALAGAVLMIALWSYDVHPILVGAAGAAVWLATAQTMDLWRPQR